MEIKDNYSLKPLNTFGIDVKAKKFAVFTSADELKECLSAFRSEPPCILGGGSNVLFTKDYDGLCLKNDMKGIELVREDDQFYYVRAAAGERWHHFVRYCIHHQYAGLENLSLIPGCVGASPMQNIGAYGVEIKDVFHELEALHTRDLSTRIFHLEDCRFGYRESVFKRSLRGQYVILAVTYRLRKKPVFHLNYGSLEAELENMGVSEPTLEAVSEAVIRIRESKLPDPARIGNAGSFFKNPTIGHDHYERLKTDFPGLVGYPVATDSDCTDVKLAAGYLIESCGWKGYRKKDYGVHGQQALVLVNYGHATGKEVLDLSADIIQSVQQKFAVTLEREVNIL